MFLGMSFGWEQEKPSVLNINYFVNLFLDSSFCLGKTTWNKNFH